ncbi:winged helix-turn-helix domain-containing protein [Marinomonas mediterranea]|uniref:winged helix-turn-helix domain-containing protein n=1 Tax=Marinomonas mediterranea TaxID=119864 RepID=UPI00234B6C77|nr:crosslink repair DNA glycosylase YcaQ family protein [Marinomonas mediterranea]WCN08999.1 winged helix-turn-helix domain-containing protein [Marinomonas mediterranea]
MANPVLSQNVTKKVGSKVSEKWSKRDSQHLRRLVLTSQGLLHTQPFGRGLSGASNAINHLGYLQIDSISVVERAHNHVLFSRVPNFNAEMLNRLLSENEIFEYWSHAAAFLPIDDFRFSLPYKNAIKNGQTHWYKQPDRKLIGELVERIRLDGPIRSRDIEADQKKNGAGWWDWKPAKKALEQLYMEGDLMVSRRDGFQKVYDLTERVLPDWVDKTPPSVDEFAEHLLDQQLRSQGMASLKSATYLRRNPELRKAMKAIIETKTHDKALEKYVLPNGMEFVVGAGAFDQRAPRVLDRVQILSPFDPVVIQRDRLQGVFQFDYQIECYVPEAKRQYGYFCLPLLYQDRFTGRMDCKVHRKTKHLEIKVLFLELDGIDYDRFLAAFSQSMMDFRTFQQCDDVSVSKVFPKHLKSKVHNALVHMN